MVRSRQSDFYDKTVNDTAIKMPELSLNHAEHEFLFLLFVFQSNKPIMEKRRRARINNCLNELKTLILDAMKKDVSTKRPRNQVSEHGSKNPVYFTACQTFKIRKSRHLRNDSETFGNATEATSGHGRSYRPWCHQQVSSRFHGMCG